MKNYVFYCMNGILDGKILQFKDDEEAIDYALKYEAEVWRIDVMENGGIVKIADFYDIFEIKQNQTSTSSQSEI